METNHIHEDVPGGVPLKMWTRGVLAQQDAMHHEANLPDRHLTYFEEGSRYFGDYVRAVGCAQKFAEHRNRVSPESVSRWSFVLVCQLWSQPLKGWFRAPS
jgi:hypothetical protein